MSYALLWIEMLVVCLLWVAMLTALAGRLGRLFFEIVTGIAFVIPLGNLLLFAIVMRYLKFAVQFRTNWFVYFCSLLIAFVIGSIVMLRLATRRRDMDPARSASSWPRARLALAFLTASVLYGMSLWNMDLAARAIAETARTEAGAMMLSVTPPVVSDDRNAAYLYVRAFDRLEADPEHYRLDRLDADFGDSSAHAKSPEAAEFLKRQMPTLRLLHDAGAMPECRFDHDYAHPSFSIRLPELTNCRTCAELLRLDAWRQLDQGNTSAVMDDIGAMLQLGRHVGREPILVSGLVSLSIDKMADDLLEEALPTVTGKQQLAAIHIGDPTEPQRIMRRAMIGEEAFGLSAFSDIASERVTFAALSGDPDFRSSAKSILTDRALGQMFYRVFFLGDDLEDYRELMMQYQRPRARDDFPASAQLEADEKKVLDAARAGIMSSLLVPPRSYSRTQCARSEAARATAIVAVAMTRYRLDHGGYPDVLPALVPDDLDDVPADPYDGKPIRLVRGADRVTIYSIGPDAKDDGGKPLDEKHQTGDLTFEMKLPPARPTTDSGK